MAIAEKIAGKLWQCWLICKLFREVGKNGIRCEKGLSISNSFSKAMFSVAQRWPLFLDDKCVGNEGEEQHRGSQLASIRFFLMEAVTQNNLWENKLLHPTCPLRTTWQLRGNSSCSCCGCDGNQSLLACHCYL